MADSSNVRTIMNFVNGEWVRSSSDKLLDVVDPGTSERIARVPLSTRDEALQAISAAKEAFKEWRETPPLTRARYMFRLKELLEQDFEETSRVLVYEEGKTLDEARGEVRRAIENVEVAAGTPSLMMGTTLEDVAKDMDCESVRQPIGVFCVIPPFNFPAMVPFWFMPYAVACGNTYIVKPSEQVPLSQNKLFETIEKVGFPKGVINLVNGSKEVVDVLLESKDVKGVSFVGSSQVAKYVYAKAAESGKRVQCLAGAKNFLIVMPDANLDKSVPAIMTSAYGAGGERCLSGSVILAVGPVYEPLKERLIKAASQIRVGYGLDENSQMGPLVSKRHMQRVIGYIEQGVKEGARLLLDGRKVKVEGYPNGFFVGPTIFDEVKPEMTVAKEEIFGPVLSIVRVKDLDEALTLANASQYGNASAIFTSGGKHAREFKYRIQCGMIGVNVGIPAPMAFFTFTGWKDSFFGDLHGHGRDAMEFFTEKKVVISRWF